MFVSVKSLTNYMDTLIGYVLDAKENHTCSEEKYMKYIESMKKKLYAQLEDLKGISSNDNLISKYENRIVEVFK